MPTQNRRVATYLPKEVDEKLESFKIERGLKGDSPALIAILSEYFGVSYQPTQTVDYSNFVRVEQFNELASKVSDLSQTIEKSSPPGAVLRRLLSRVESLEESGKQVTDLMAETGGTHTNTTNTLIETPVSPGQMSFLNQEGGSPSNPESELPKLEKSESKGDSLSELQPMKSQPLSRRFKLNEKAVMNAKTTIWRKDPQKFIEWTRERDPDRIPWQYNPEDKLYHPIEEEF